MTGSVATRGLGAAPLVRGGRNPELRAALEQIRDTFERLWCDEPVPALGGLTPRAAAG